MTTLPSALRPAMPGAPRAVAIPSGVSRPVTTLSRVAGWGADLLWVAGALLLLPAVILLVGAPIALVVRLVMAIAQGLP